MLDPALFAPPTFGSLAKPQALTADAQPLDFGPFRGLIRIDDISAQRGFGQDNLNPLSEDEDPTQKPETKDVDALKAIEEAQQAFHERLKEGFLSASPDPSPRLARDLDPRFDARIGTKSREIIYGASVRAADEARKQADRLICEAWNKRMLALKEPAQPSPALGEALNAGYPYLEVRCLGCDTHQTVVLEIIRRSKTAPIHELERYMRCKECSQVRGYSYKRSHLVVLRADQDFSE
jgi:hypothetical protein